MSSLGNDIENIAGGGEFYRTLGSRVKAARLARRMTQEELADRIYLERTSVCNIEMGKQRLLVHTIWEIAEALLVTVDSLLPPIPRGGVPLLDARDLELYALRAENESLQSRVNEAVACLTAGRKQETADHPE